jgi:hypothetical protein
LISAQIEKTGTDFVYTKLNLTRRWPLIATPEKPWNQSEWKPLDYSRYLIDLFIDSDLKNISQRILYVC